MKTGSYMETSFVLLFGVLTYHAIKTLLEIPYISRLKTSIVQRMSKHATTHLLTGHE